MMNSAVYAMKMLNKGMEGEAEKTGLNTDEDINALVNEIRFCPEVARLISHDKSESFLTDELTGVLKSDYNDKKIRAERAKR